jgi:two-component system response regulator AtoC/two-component system nitrogen regulation response regulator NtrX
MDLLIVDDERPVRFGIKKALKRLGLAMAEACSGKEALEVLREATPAVVLMDLNMPGMNGLEALDRIVAQGPGGPRVIMLTAFGSERLAVDAMKRGAHDYLTKPYEVDELRLVVEKALQSKALEQENFELRSQLERFTGQKRELLGNSAAMRAVWTRLSKAAPTDVTVLIQGESGTGKELVARAIHRLSRRSEQPFISTNCAAIPDELIESELFGYEKGAFTGATEARAGKFERASGGTLFLDEIGDMSLKTQAKVLRVLQERSIQRLGSSQDVPVDVRVLAATHRDLPRLIESGSFREDLYYRLKVIVIHIPSLDHRREDIPLLADHFLAEACDRHGVATRILDAPLLRALSRAPWRGNVRQLRNQIEAAVVLSDQELLTVDNFEGLAEPGKTPEEPGLLADLDFTLSFREAKKLYVERFEKAFLLATLERCGGNISRAARVLDMHRQTLQQKLRSLDLREENQGPDYNPTTRRN